MCRFIDTLPMSLSFTKSCSPGSMPSVGLGLRFISSACAFSSFTFGSKIKDFISLTSVRGCGEGEGVEIMDGILIQNFLLPYLQERGFPSRCRSLEKEVKEITHPAVEVLD